ncbi:hypothetical protein [Aureivirga sp. CE67]|uniref:hypothetical protein n=1 Tax=Aureivirga sp. CE67 TaxID=1788983 RepID=UPI0018C9CD34|nr:hypothetical protein [Aureivirga sp. CE67]
MNEIKQFLNSFFEAEVEAWHASTKRDTDNTKQKIDKMHSFCIEKLHNKFGLVRVLVHKSDDFYERNKDASKFSPRHLFKLSHYSHEKYGDLYLAYVSSKDGDEFNLEYFNCFFITKVEDNLKIAKKAWVTEDDGDYGNKYWKMSDGYGDLSFENTDKFISCERYLEPEDCDFSMKDYLADK